MTTITHPRGAQGRPRRTEPPPFTRSTEEQISGRYRPITTHQLAMAWWLYRSGQITRRQLRIYFAAHEMSEQRRYAAPERRGHARFELSQLKRLVGGRGSLTADRDLSADVHQLRELGLVAITSEAIGFASSIEQLRLTEDLEDFWTFFRALPHSKRRVPVPRRTLRALAAGFSRGVTAYVLASLIRSVFWKRHPSGGGGEYTTDGRTKGSWIASTFGVSRRAISEARSQLIELGWLKPLDAQQWELNRWGVHDVVNVHWSPARAGGEAGEPVENTTAPQADRSGEPATPQGRSSGESATPCLNRSSLPTGDSRTRKLRADAPSPSGVCTSSSRRRNGPKRPARSVRPSDKPNIRDVRTEHLKDPEALQKLRTQAIALGFEFEGGSGELDFFALANRALSRGHRPGALFFDLISKRRTAFITIADEEQARRQLRELRDGPEPERGGGGEMAFTPKRQNEAPSYTQDEAIVLACQKSVRNLEPEALFRQARRHLGSDWTLERWMRAHFSVRQKDARRWQVEGDELELGGLL